ncbi:hypothetical protein Q777_GL000237 [Lacticaseibacillus rhamnosus DSM 20021 = JCM 1136 = NBRC 3425]|jgi:hypothetical protein|uniref:Uncharacterized protein n=1 Tax=Lacticaseibacillus rhamnosus (strain LMS2-1) TaxID=525361 RepID=C2JY55_LACRM|nr:conserved hypothetical protein [Lacticaseibacillus rhamnosus ATCC 8530]EEN80108.1 hypothetical protein HMPREF0539_1840 [Lacticaseibacillus rhamnosus LMS2-1]KRK32251.1 hypothetical protein Q777_GL000237 [Lacticaseibacillus rhamnosus DSM 20021 = JCM 1136 = NBRC 3425]CAR90603.1 Putative protein without homology [Lacticaseibacillus rhamnosus Lc 705]
MSVGKYKEGIVQAHGSMNTDTILRFQFLHHFEPLARGFYRIPSHKKSVPKRQAV